MRTVSYKKWRFSRLGFMLVGGWQLVSGSASATKVVTYDYTDPNGSVLATADSAGNTISQSDFSPYGEPMLSSQQNGPSFTGHVGDPDTSLVYMQARYYDPSVGRFLSTDSKAPSAGTLETFSRYAYADDNPASKMDPDGRQAVSCCAYGVYGARFGNYMSQIHALPASAGSQMQRIGVEANGTAAFGIGIGATKGFRNADSSIGFVPLGEGLEASVDFKYKMWRFTLPAAVESGIAMQGKLSVHALGGGSLSWEYDPGGSLTIYLAKGLGLGESFSLVTISKTFKEDNSTQAGHDGQSTSEDIIKEPCYDMACHLSMQDTTSRMPGGGVDWTRGRVMTEN